MIFAQRFHFPANEKIDNNYILPEPITPTLDTINTFVSTMNYDYDLHTDFDYITSSDLIQQIIESVVYSNI